MADRTSGLDQFRSGCSGLNWLRYQASLPGSQAHAGSPAGNARVQLLGNSPGLSLRQWYQLRLGLSRDERDSINHGWASLVWLGTQSRMIRRLRWCTASTNSSKSASVPNSGSMSQ